MTDRDLVQRVADRLERTPCDERDWLDHLEAELLTQLDGQEQEHGCAFCGRRLWAPAIAGMGQGVRTPVCCGWEMIGLPPMRPAPSLKRASAPRPSPLSLGDEGPQSA